MRLVSFAVFKGVKEHSFSARLVILQILFKVYPLDLYSSLTCTFPHYDNK